MIPPNHRAHPVSSLRPRPQPPGPQSPCRRHGPPIVIPGSVYRKVSWQADRITRVLGLPRDRVDDIAGELNLRLAAALRRYDASKGTVRAFANAVLAKQYMRVIQRARAEYAKHRAVPLSSLDERHEPQVRSDNAMRFDGWTGEEVRAALKTLSPDDLIFARLVANLSTRAVARAVGCHHGTVVRGKQRLCRQIRAAILQKRENARTARGCSAERSNTRGRIAPQEITHGHDQV